MSEFNETNWRAAISKLYTRSVTDAVYRQLCLNDPRAAIAEVSDINLPATFKFEFVPTHDDLSYSYVLPPALGDAAPSPDALKKIIDWQVYCTDTYTHWV